MLNQPRSTGSLSRMRIDSVGKALLVFFLVICSSLVHASQTELEETALEIIPGAIIKRIKADVHYEEKDSSHAKWFNVKDRYAKNKNELSGFIAARYNFNQQSFLIVDYTEDYLRTNVAAYERVKIWFFPITIGLRLPLDIDAQRLTLLFGRQLFASNDFELGWMLGAQLVDLNGEVTYPGGLKESEHVLAPFPELGLFAGYRLSENLRCTIMAKYFSITSMQVGDLDIDGSMAEADIAITYKLAKYVSFGLVYRYSKVRMEIDAEDYRADGSYSTYGPGLFFKATF